MYVITNANMKHIAVLSELFNRLVIVCVTHVDDIIHLSKLKHRKYRTLVHRTRTLLSKNKNRCTSNDGRESIIYEMLRKMAKYI